MYTNRLALLLLIGLGLWSSPAGAQKGLTAADAWRLQQARAAAANNYYKYSGSGHGAYSQYGTLSNSVERVDKSIGDNSKYLSEYDFYEFSNRLNTLKQQVGSNVSRGLNTDNYQPGLQSLEDEFTRKVNDSKDNLASAKKRVNQAITELEDAFSSSKSKLEASDLRDLDAKISDLKSRSTDEALLESLGSNASDLIGEARHLENTVSLRAADEPTILNGLIRRNQETPNKDKESISPAVSEPEPSAAEKLLRPSGSPVKEPVLTPPSTSKYRPKPPPPPPLAKVFEGIENTLLDLRAVGGLGTFDMDRYTERLLRVKLNQQKMLSKNGRLSVYQEQLLREELAGIKYDINQRMDPR